MKKLIIDWLDRKRINEDSMKQLSKYPYPSKLDEIKSDVRFKSDELKKYLHDMEEIINMRRKVFNEDNLYDLTENVEISKYKLGDLDYSKDKTIRHYIMSSIPFLVKRNYNSLKIALDERFDKEMTKQAVTLSVFLHLPDALNELFDLYGSEYVIEFIEDTLDRNSGQHYEVYGDSTVVSLLKLNDLDVGEIYKMYKNKASIYIGLISRGYFNGDDDIKKIL